MLVDKKVSLSLHNSMCFFAPPAMQNSNTQQSNLSKKFKHFIFIHDIIYLEHKLLPYALGTPLGL